MPSDRKERTNRSRSRGRRNSRDKYSDRASKERDERRNKGFSSRKGESSGFMRKSKFDSTNEEKTKSSGF